jgi:general transcription factor IIIA
MCYSMSSLYWFRMKILLFRCSYEDCQAVFALPSALKRHENSHYREYKCNKEGCVYVTNKWSLLRKHIADVHQTKHVCSICGLTVSTSKQLNIHSQIHQKERQVFACTWKDCDRSYTTVSNLQQHLKSFHLKVKPYNCTRPNCSATFAHKVLFLMRSKIVYNFLFEHK